MREQGAKSCMSWSIGMEILLGDFGCIIVMGCSIIPHAEGCGREKGVISTCVE